MTTPRCVCVVRLLLTAPSETAFISSQCKQTPVTVLRKVTTSEMEREPEFTVWGDTRARG